MLKFHLAVDGIDLEDWDVLDALAEQAPDVQFVARDGATFAIVITDASLVDALLDTTSAITAVVPDAVCTRIDEDYVATPDIAKRCDVSRETVRLWSLKPDFPVARGVVGNGIKIWDWATINQWLLAAYHGELGDTARLLLPQDVARANALLRKLPAAPAASGPAPSAWTPVPEGRRTQFVSTAGDPDRRSVAAFGSSTTVLVK